MYWRAPWLDWHINYLQFAFPLAQLCTRRWISHCAGLPMVEIWVRTKKKKRERKSQQRAKGKPTRWKVTPPFCWFPDKHNDNNFLSIWCLLLSACGNLDKRSLRKERGGGMGWWVGGSNMVLRVYSDHTICFLKSTFKTQLWAVPTALSLKLRLTLCSPLYYFPSV